MIKTTKIPIICICNDRQSLKIRSLVNHCFDLRFQRPKVDQIKGAMMSVCFKEGITIEPQALREMIIASGQDVRQVLHNLLLWSASSKKMNTEEVQKAAANAKKNSKMVGLSFSPIFISCLLIPPSFPLSLPPSHSPSLSPVSLPSFLSASLPLSFPHSSDVQMHVYCTCSHAVIISILQSPFDVVRTVFSPMEGEREFTLNEKSDLFFHDYSLASLFVQENYVSARPSSTRCVEFTHESCVSLFLLCLTKEIYFINLLYVFITSIFRGNVIATLKCLAKAADSLCDGDLVEKKIRSSSNWTLLPLQV